MSLTPDGCAKRWPLLSKVVVDDAHRNSERLDPLSSSRVRCQPSHTLRSRTGTSLLATRAVKRLLTPIAPEEGAKRRLGGASEPLGGVEPRLCGLRLPLDGNQYSSYLSTVFDVKIALSRTLATGPPSRRTRGSRHGTTRYRRQRAASARAEPCSSARPPSRAA